MVFLFVIRTVHKYNRQKKKKKNLPNLVSLYITFLFVCGSDQAVFGNNFPFRLREMGKYLQQNEKQLKA